MATNAPNSEFPIPLVKRPGIRIKKIYFQSVPQWVVKLPHDQEFYHLNHQEFTILDSLDGKISYRQLEEKFNREHSPYRINYREITRLLTDFFTKSLLEPTRSGVGLGLHLHSREKGRQKLKKKLKNILAIQWKGWDPEWFLEKTNPYVTWFFSKPVVAFNLLLFFSVLCWIGIHYDEFFSQLPGLTSLFQPENWLSLAIVVTVGKFLHELGHAYAEKRFGGECHEIGVMIFFFMPTLYCNTSDSWLLPNKWHRMYIGMGGVYVELIIFTLAAILWWVSQSVDVQSFCMNIMFVTSVSGILTNGNPLLRYDGYFVLADWLEVPNLSQKANREIKRVFLHHCCGDHRQVDLWTSRYNKIIFLVYGLAAFCFRLFLVTVITFFTISFFQSVGLGNVGVVMAIVFTLTVFVTPVKAIYEHLKQPGNWQQMKRRNLIATGSVVGLVMAALFLVPLPYWVPAECAVLISDEVSVRATQTGRIAEIYVRPGDRVTQGQKLIRLANEELEEEGVQTSMGLEQARKGIELAYRSPSSELNSQVPSEQSITALKSEEKMLAEQLTVIEEKLEKLILRAPCDGVVYGVIDGTEKSQTRTETVNQRVGNPLDPTSVGSYVTIDTKICFVAPESAQEISLTFEQDHSSLVKVGQKTRMLVSCYPERLLGEVQKVASSESYGDKIPEQIASQSTATAVSLAKEQASPGGSKASSYKDGQVLSSTLIEATSSHNCAGRLVYGSTGSAYIHVGSRTAAQRIWHWVSLVLQENL